MSVAVVARSAISGLGAEPGDLAPRRVGDAPRVAIAHDPELAAAGLVRPNASRVAGLDLASCGPDRAAQLLGTAVVDLAAALDQRLSGWRDLRLGIALGTSSGGMTSIEELFRARHAGVPVTPPLARRATYFAPVAPAFAAAGLDVARAARRTHVLAACAASTFAIGAAMRWLQRGAVDLAIAGGYDALSLLVAAGFEAIRATSATAPRPFRVGRDGMALGEGAGLVAMVRAGEERGVTPAFFVHGFGAATDAVHITAPDRTGDGLARAAEAALAESGVAPAEVGLVSAHATATAFNDAMEARAIRRALSGVGAPVHALKAQIGHTLGAAGVLETIAAAESLARGLLPPTAGAGEIDPDAEVPLLEVAAAVRAPAHPLVLKLSAAFGGANAALVVGDASRVGRRAASPRRPRRVALAGRARVSGAESARAALDAAGIPLDRRSKLDSLSLLACGAVAALVATGAPIAGGGIIVGHALATVDIDERFFARILARGGAQGEPRLFPATSPNVSAGHAAILFGLRGPSAAVSGGLDGGSEALALAAELVAAGDADGIVVVAVDEIGSAGTEILAHADPARVPPPVGAAAAWLTAAEGGVEVPLGIQPDHDGSRIGHEAFEARLDALASASPAR